MDWGSFFYSSIAEILKLDANRFVFLNEKITTVRENVAIIIANINLLDEQQKTIGFTQENINYMTENIQKWESLNKTMNCFLWDIKIIEYDIYRKLFEYNHSIHNNYSLSTTGLVHFQSTSWKTNNNNNNNNSKANEDGLDSFSKKINSIWMNSDRIKEIREFSFSKRNNNNNNNNNNDNIININSIISEFTGNNSLMEMNFNLDHMRCENCHKNAKSLCVLNEKHFDVCSSNQRTVFCVCHTKLYPYCNSCLLKQFSNGWKSNFNTIINLDENSCNTKSTDFLSKIANNNNRCCSTIVCPKCSGELCCFQIIDLKSIINEKDDSNNNNNNNNNNDNNINNVMDLLKKIENRLFHQNSTITTTKSNKKNKTSNITNNNNNTVITVPDTPIINNNNNNNISGDVSDNNNNNNNNNIKEKNSRFCSKCGAEGHYYKKHQN